MKKFKHLAITRNVFICSLATALLVVAANTDTPPQKPHGIGLSTQPSSSGQVQGDSTTASEPAPQVTIKTVAVTEVIPFKSVTENDTKLPKGQSKIVATGINGVETLTYKLTYTDGQQTDKQLVSDAIATPAVNQLTAIGTYVAPAPKVAATKPTTPSCPNGAYENADGETTCVPSTIPDGATALCADGTFSFSKHHHNACLNDDGIAEWL